VAGRSSDTVAGLGRGFIGLSKLPLCLGPIAQLVERLAGSQKVRGSNPLGSTSRENAASLGCTPFAQRITSVRESGND
jgi:hypothetical protein